MTIFMSNLDSRRFRNILFSIPIEVLQKISLKKMLFVPIL